MSEYPAVVKLCQQFTNKNVHKWEVIDSLRKYYKIVHFVKQLIADINAMHSDDYYSHDFTNYGQP